MAINLNQDNHVGCGEARTASLASRLMRFVPHRILQVANCPGLNWKPKVCVKPLIYARVSIVMLAIYGYPVTAEIMTDGSLGSAATDLTGPNYAITPDLGQQSGSHLFHSFSTFNLANGEHANFSAGNGIQNIIARITGGEVSSIDGTIHSESASLWITNPAGWVFGAHVKVNVNGAFHVSTADSVRFEDGHHFYADPAGQSVLTISKPVGMSFMQPPQTGIALDQTVLELPEQSTLSVLAAHVSMSDATIQSPSGQILIGAAATAGDWTINEQGLHTDNTMAYGHIDILNKPVLPNINEPAIDISDETTATGGGKIQLIAEDTRLHNATLIALTSGEQKGGDINLINTGNLDLVRTTIQSDAQAGSKGDAGTITITTNNLAMIGDSAISATGERFSEGQAGQIDLNINQTLSMHGGNTLILSTANGLGEGGTIKINAETIDMTEAAAIRATTGNVRNAGDIEINSRQITMQSGATIDNSALVLDSTIKKGGTGGQLNITTYTLNLTGATTFITSSSIGHGGQGGDIDIQATQLNLNDLAEIRAKSESGADAGNIEITNGGQMHVDNAKITTQANNAEGGQITINSQDLILTNTQVTTSVEGVKGDGGNITVNSEILAMNNGFVQANTSAQNGQGGAVRVKADQFIVSGTRVVIGGKEQLPFTAHSGRNVIQAAAPDGVSGPVTVSNVELNIAGNLKPIQSNYAVVRPIFKDPCKIPRGQAVSSLIEQGQSGLPVNATEVALSSTVPADIEFRHPTVNVSSESEQAIKSSPQCSRTGHK